MTLRFSFRVGAEGEGGREGGRVDNSSVCCGRCECVCVWGGVVCVMVWGVIACV